MKLILICLTFLSAGAFAAPTAENLKKLSDAMTVAHFSSAVIHVIANDKQVVEAVNNVEIAGVQAERSNAADGRQYKVTFSASEPEVSNGGAYPCTFYVDLTVPLAGSEGAPLIKVDSLCSSQGPLRR